MRGSKRLKCALILSAACSGSDSDSQLSEELDSGGNTGNDAATEDPEDPEDGGPDAAEPPLEAGADASLPDAAGPVPGSITVTTHVRCCEEAAGTIKPDVEVVTVNPDGTLGPTGRTGVDGKLTLEGVYEGSLVTALYEPEGESTEHEYVSFAGVKPGDSLTFGEAYYQKNAKGTAGQATVSFPAHQGTSYYYPSSPCNRWGSFSSPPATLDLYESCQTPTSPVLFTAYDSDHKVVASKFVPDLATTPGATNTISALNPVAADNFAVTVADLDPDVTRVRFDLEPVYAPSGLIERPMYQHILSGVDGITLSVPTDGLRQLHTSRFVASYQYAPHEFYVGASGAADSATVTGGGELPWLAEANFSPLGATWLQTDGSYDGAVAMVSWYKQPEVQGDMHYYRWVAILPPGQTSLRWDNLAMALRERLPAFTDELSDSDVMLIDLTGPATYDELRQVPEWMLTCPSCAVYDGELPSARVTADGAEGF